MCSGFSALVYRNKTRANWREEVKGRPLFFSNIMSDKIADIDKKFYVVTPDPDFNPDRNKAIIENSIKKYEATRKKKNAEYVDKLRERTDAVATYLKSRWAESDRPVEKYFGKRMLAHLRAQKIVQKLKGYTKEGKPIIELSEIK